MLLWQSYAAVPVQPSCGLWWLRFVDMQVSVIWIKCLGKRVVRDILFLPADFEKMWGEVGTCFFLLVCRLCKVIIIV